MDWWRKNTEPERKERTTAQTQWWAHHNAHAYMCWAVKLKHHKLSCRLSPLTSKYGPKAERNKNGVGEWVGGRLTSCIWALKSAHEDNWKDCIITWATACGGEHTAHSPWSGTDTQQANTHTHTGDTHSSCLSWKTLSFPVHGVSSRSRWWQWKGPVHLKKANLSNRDVAPLLYCSSNHYCSGNH